MRRRAAERANTAPSPQTQRRTDGPFGFSLPLLLVEQGTREICATLLCSVLCLSNGLEIQDIV